MDDDSDRLAPLREARELLDRERHRAQIAEHEEWRRRREADAFWNLPRMADYPPRVADLPPVSHEKAFSGRSTATKNPPRAKPMRAFSKVQVEAIGSALGQAIANERKAMREHVAAELEALRTEVRELRAEIAVRSEINQLHQSLAVLRSDPRHVIDLPPTPVPRRSGAL